MSAGGGGHAADPITTKRMVTGLKRAYPLTRQAPDGGAEEEEEELELSLGLAIGGGSSKGKATAGAPPARLQDVGIRARNPVAPPAMPMRVPGSLNGSEFASMFVHRSPQAVSGSGQSWLNPMAPRCLSVPALASPIVNPNHCTNPQCYANPNRAPEMGGKRMRLVPSFSGSSAGGVWSSSSGEFTQSNSNPKATVREAMSTPTTPAIPEPFRSRLDEKPKPCVITRGIDGRKTAGVLYMYNDLTEICIVCICHGESFTPAEFVRHGGGVESSHPLRQIVLL